MIAAFLRICARSRVSAPIGVLCFAFALTFVQGAPGAAQQPSQPAPDPAQQQAPAPGAQTAPQAPAATPAETPQAAPVPAPAEQAPAAPAQATPPAQAPAPAPAAATAPASATKPAAAPPPQATPTTEEELRQMLVGKPLYLRGGYLDNSLTFDEVGRLIGNSPKGSFTLSGIQIDKVRMTRHKIELEGQRYALHFLGGLPTDDPTKAVDRVKITPKKKVVKITIDRELVVAAKKEKPEKQEKNKAQSAAQPAPQHQAKVKPGDLGPPPSPSAQPAQAAPAAPSPSAQPAAQTTAQAAPPAAANEPLDEDKARAEMAAAPLAERPADPGSVTSTTSQGHANKVLRDALDHVFAFGLDDRMMASMPDFWKLYYKAVAGKTDYRPGDPAVLRQNAVDQKAALVTKFEPESNDFAQASGIAGPALYHAVIGVDGKPQEIAVARPIGFGLDENAVAAIRKATFQPALKAGQPVPVMLDLVVQFRIYSKRTAVAGKPEEAEKPAEPTLPGPYSTKQP